MDGCDVDGELEEEVVRVVEDAIFFNVVVDCDSFGALFPLHRNRSAACEVSVGGRMSGLHEVYVPVPGAR